MHTRSIKAQKRFKEVHFTPSWHQRCPSRPFLNHQASALTAFVSSPPAAIGSALAIVLWTGLVTTAFPTFGQSFGQRVVPAATANIIYTTQPLWSAFFGYFLLGETLSNLSLVGAALIFAALLVAASSPNEGARRVE